MKSLRLKVKRQWASLVMLAIIAGCAYAAAQPAAAQPAAAQPPQPVPPKLPTTTVETLSAEEVGRAMGGPTLVTLSFQDAPAQVVFDELSKQTGITFLTWPRNLLQQRPPVTIDIQRRPFWTAFRSLAAQLNLHRDRSRKWPGLTLEPGPDPNLRGLAYESGPILIVANDIHRTRQVSLTDYPGQAPNIDDRIKVLFSCFLDPKLHVIGSRAECRFDEAVDENGVSLLPDGVQEYRVGLYAPNSRSPFAWEMAGFLQRPAQAGQRLSRLKGTLRFLVATRLDTWEIDNVLQAKEVSKTVVAPGIDWRFVVHHVTESNQSYNVKMSYTTQLKPPQEKPVLGSPWQRVFQHFADGLRLVDDQGRDLVATSRGSWGNHDRGPEYWIPFTRERWGSDEGDNGTVGAPVKLIWEFPAEIKYLDIPFEFNEMPLP